MDEGNETNRVEEDRQRRAVGQRAEAIMTETGVSWSSAWLQAQRELGPAPTGPRQRITLGWWPYFMIGAAVIFIPAAFVVLLFLALVTVGTPTSDGLNTFVNIVVVIMLLLWLMIPVSLAVIAIRLARSTAGVAGAWFGVAVWLAISVWFVSTL